jgi:hypothetical protein
MAFKYAYARAPFNFLGHLSSSQKDAFKDWANARSDNFDAIQMHHRIKAQQLRKTAGVLEKFYAEKNDQKLTPTFEKGAWQPGENGHFNYSPQNDHIPMVIMSKIKARFKEQLQRDDEGVFHMNHIRYLIEKHEDTAQFTKDFTDSGVTDNFTQLLSDIENAFAQPEYQSVLVDDVSNLYKGEPYFRVHPADKPTQWELEQMNHSSSSLVIEIKEREA